MELPRRDENHGRASWSTRAFAAALPSEWLVHDLETDYGIDCRVEIFEDGRTTGLFFNVQLKSTAKGKGDCPARPIKRSTLNYWAQTPDPTLIVIGHEPTRALWFQWFHLLPFDNNLETKSRLVRCETILNENSVLGLMDEASAWRSARRLVNHLPVDIHLSGGKFYGESSRELKRAISHKLSNLPSFLRVVHSGPSRPFLSVSIEGDMVVVGLTGDFSRNLTWGLEGDRDYNSLAADVIASLALACANVGAEILCIKLLEIAAPTTNMLFGALAFGDAMAFLVRNGSYDSALILLRRSAGVEGHQSCDLALAAVNSVRAPAHFRQSVAFMLRDASRTWSKPAAGIYNAANILASLQVPEALDLYDEAAAADASYLERGYWWREKGAVHWHLRQVAEAEICYERALEFGEVQARPLLADLMMRTGRYLRAQELFGASVISEGLEDSQWRLTLIVLDYLVGDLGYSFRERDSLDIPHFGPGVDEDAASLEVRAQDVIREDPLNGFAHSCIAGVQELRGESATQAHLVAAVTINVDQLMWLNLCVSSRGEALQGSTSGGRIYADALSCAWRNFGSSFGDLLVEYEFFASEEVRLQILTDFEAARPSGATLELRRFTGAGGYESTRIPIEESQGSFEVG